jgi:hypothetical protein
MVIDRTFQISGLAHWTMITLGFQKSNFFLQLPDFSVSLSQLKVIFLINQALLEISKTYLGKIFQRLVSVVV